MRRIDHQTMKKDLSTEFGKMVRHELRTNLNIKSLFKALKYKCMLLDTHLQKSTEVKKKQSLKTCNGK